MIWSKKFDAKLKKFMTKKNLTITALVAAGLVTFWFAGGGTFLKEVFSSRAGGANEEENIDVSKFLRPDQCTSVYPWGPPKIKDKIVNERSLYMCRNSYAIQYDTKIKVPLWEVEILNKKNLVQFNIPSNMVPSLDPEVPKKMQGKMEDFAKAGYMMGFLAPIQNMYINNSNMPYEQLEQVNREALQQSLYLTSVVPETKAANNIRRQIDDEARRIVMQRNELFLVSGPVFLNGQTKGFIGEGDNQVAVPTHIYKIMTDPLTYGSIAYIIPNEQVLNCGGQACNLENFIVPIKEVERVTGIEFYSKLAPYYAVQVKQDVNEVFKNKRNQNQ